MRCACAYIARTMEVSTSFSRIFLQSVRRSPEHKQGEAEERANATTRNPKAVTWGPGTLDARWACAGGVGL